MAIELKEYCGFVAGPSFSLKESYSPVTLQETNTVAEDCVLVDIEGIHAYPVSTRNFTRYMEEALKNSVPYWTQPYERPLIKHHNEQNGKTIGRVIAAEYTQSKFVKDGHALTFTAMVPKEPEASDVQTGLLKTVSIGAISQDVRCSICGHNLAKEGPCEHERGHVYDGEICYWDVYEIEPKELSYVVVPSDPYAQNIRVYTKKSVVPPKPLKEAADDNLVGGKPLDEKEKEKLEQQIAELNQKVSQLEAEKAAAEKNLETEKTTVSELNQKIENAVAELQKKTEEAEKKEEELAAVKEENESLKQQQETAEQQAVAAQESYHELLGQSINLVRKATGRKELEESVIKSRSSESLKDTFVDLLEEYGSGTIITHMNPDTVPNPGLPNLEEKANKKDVLDLPENKKQTDSRTMLEKLFTSIT